MGTRLILLPLFAVLLLSSSAGCERVSSVFNRSRLPDTGPPLSAAVWMEFDPSLIKAKANYIDGCNHPMELMIGPVLQDTLLQAADQTFKAVTVGDRPGNIQHDIHIRIKLLTPRLSIKNDAVYDRAPVELSLDALAEYRDASGKLLAEQPLQTTRKERLQIEPTQRRCAYSTIDGFTHDAAVAMSVLFMREARALLDPSGQPASDRQAATPAVKPTPPPAPALSFKATISDENGNLILEGGERVKIRVEVANAGTGPATGVSAKITGPPVIVSQFPASSLPIGAMQPGESRSLEFAATVPRMVEPQRVDLVVAVTEASGAATPPSQTLAAMMRPGGETHKRVSSSGGFDTIDRVPAALPGFQRPQTYLISIGISSHRDQPSSVRKYAALDAELVENYFRALGGIPAANVRMLLDRKASRPDIEETILDWLPAHVTPDSLIIVYFAGQAKVTLSGEVFLVPYEGGQSVSRLFPVKDLLADLTRLKARSILFIFDGSIAKLDDAQGKSKDPQWGPAGGNVARLIGTTGFHSGLEPEKLHHGLFTYYMLKGLRGEADENGNRDITLGELAEFLEKTVAGIARQEFRQDQRPLVIPTIQPGSKLGSMSLTQSTPAAIDGR